MIKRYIGLSLVTASLVLAGCSSSDDDDPMTTPTPTPDPVTCDPCASPDVTLNMLETATNAGNFTTLLSLADASGIDLTGDGFNTVFAPTDDAFAALPEGTLESLTPEQVTDILQFHIVPNSALSAKDLVPGTSLTMANGKAAEVTADADGNLAVAGVVIAGADVYATNGVIHVVDTVLPVPEEAPEPAPEPEPEPTPDPTPGEKGPAETALSGTGNHGAFVSQFNATIGLPAIDDNVWTVFAPTDAALAGGDIGDGQNYVYVNGKLAPADLLALGSVMTNGGNSYGVGGTEDALTVNGHAVSVAHDGANAIVYSIDGTLD